MADRWPRCSQSTTRIKAMNVRHLILTLLVTLAVAFTVRADAENKFYDLVVIGGTPGGVACAVRAAREGLSVLLVNRHDHLGGILTSGLGVWDSQYEGKRAPIY